MIVFVTRREYTYMVGGLVDAHPAMRRRMRLLPYERLFMATRLPVASYVFCDIDRLSPAEQQLAARYHAALADPATQCCVVNHPARSLRRYPLLRRLHETGRNDFDAYRLDEERRPRRYPVFIREENEHHGPITPLLEDRDAFEVAVDRLAAAGRPREGLVAIEFCGGADGRGVHRRYSVTAAIGRVVRRRMSFSRNWAVKRAEFIDDETRAEERRYIEENPHEAQIAEVFRLAAIDYGRADYNIVGGRLQVYEVNTNPTLWTPSEARIARDPPKVARHAEHLGPLAERLADALEAPLSPAARAGTLPDVALPAPQWREYRRLAGASGYLPRPVAAALRLSWNLRRRLWPVRPRR